MPNKVRNKQAAAEKKKRREQEYQQSLQKKARNKKILKISVIALIAVCLVLALVFIALTIIENSGVKLRSQVFLKTDNFSVDGTMMSYLVYDSYNSFKEYFGEYLPVDTTKDLKDQQCSYATESMGTGNKTWFDYFEDDAENTAKSLLRSCELALKNGITLSDEDLYAVNIRAKETDLSKIGHGVNTDDVANCLKLQTLASKYMTKITSGIEVTEEEIDEYYEQHRDDYDQIKYMRVSYSYDSQTFEQINQRITSLSEAEDYRLFLVVYKQFLKEDNDSNPDQSIDEHTFTVTKNDNELTDDLIDWLFTSEKYSSRVVNTTQSDDETKGTLTVYYIVSDIAPDTSKTRTVRHILFDANTYGSDEKAEKMANSVMEKFKSNPTLEYFTQLVCAYSSDPGSISRGGLYPYVKEKELVAGFNNWTFSDERKHGDADVITSSYGYHIVYFEDEGLPAYKGDVYKVLFKEDFDQMVEKLSDIGVNENRKVLNDISGKY